MANEGLRRFVLSWDFEENEQMTGEDFRIALVKILLYNKCTDLKSYTNSCVYFTCKAAFTTSKWGVFLLERYKDILTFNISEVAKDSEGYFERYALYYDKHFNKFNQLVIDIKADKSK